ncbi:rhodanese-like domain-containing protein 7 [Cucurbita moschata]|uniref:Rhodanese-like domain-containing protein 7 n=1 Tax=Cucurbita moschata TaxID=3662 RepID=A0A6J1FRM3_CUCMO|nr:rhodanese-like domain-containing protein 7 [Cucurbita moschata]
MLRYRAPPLLALGMVSPLLTSSSSSSSSFSSNPNLITFNPSFLVLKPSPTLPSLLSSFHQKPTRSMTHSKCFSGPSPAVPIPTACEAQEVDSVSLVVVSFYKFADFPDHAEFRSPLKKLCQELRVSGGIILAPEGINGSICGSRESVQRVLGFIESDERLKGLRQVETPVSPEEEAIHHGHSSGSPLAAGEDAPFRWDHVRVKLKKEIVTLGMPDVSPVERAGQYVKPRDWNALISDPDTVVIDVRNHYETRIGKFKRAVDPCTPAFRDFPFWVEDKFQLPKSDCEHSNEEVEGKTVNPEQNSPPRVAMYCTGGIRCEKASSYLLSKGFKEVYHLEGGILKYLEEVPKTESLWEGECFVFDKRVSVEHGLEQGTFKLCYGCKQPVSDADMESPQWEYGVSCPHCYSTKSEEEKERARARQRQFETWGIIGGPDKGRRPKQSDKNATLPNSI